MVINDVMARRFFRGVNPIGQVVTYDGPTTIVGITRARRVDGPESDLQPGVFTPLAQKRFLRPDLPSRGLVTLGRLLNRTQADPRRVEAAVRAAIAPVFGRERMTIRRAATSRYRHTDGAWRLSGQHAAVRASGSDSSRLVRRPHRVGHLVLSVGHVPGPGPATESGLSLTGHLVTVDIGDVRVQERMRLAPSGEPTTAPASGISVRQAGRWTSLRSQSARAAA